MQELLGERVYPIFRYGGDGVNSGIRLGFTNKWLGKDRRTRWGRCCLAACFAALAFAGEAATARVSLPALSSQAMGELQQKEASDAKGRLQVGVGRALEQAIVVNGDSAGWVQTNGVWSWAVEIEVAGALGLRVHLEEINLPTGTRILLHEAGKPGARVEVIDSGALSGVRGIWTETQFCERLVLRCEAGRASDVHAVAFAIRELSHIYALPALKEGV